MTLEAFFTLTERKDGLTVTSRVEELVSVLQNNNGSVLKNAGRQWTAVASTIAATKNRECLDVFVNLDGLLYLGSWLAQAQVFANDSIDTTIEDSILALLQAFQNLGVDRSRLVSSGIWFAVKKLAHHGTSRVQDQARKLFGSWNDDKGYDHSERDTESCSKVHEDEMRSVAVSGETSEQNNNKKDSHETADAATLSGSSEEKGLELQNDMVEFESNMNSHCSDTRTETLNCSSTDDMMKQVEENRSMRETIGPTSFGIMPTGSGGLLYSERDSLEGPLNVPFFAEIPKEKKIDIYGNFLEQSGRAVAETSSSAGHVVASSDSIIASMELEKNSLVQSSLDSNEVSREASETLCGLHDVSKHVPSLTHIIDNPDSDNSSGLSAGNGRHRKVKSAHAEKEEEKDDMLDSNRKKRVEKRKKCSSSRSMTVSQCLGAIDRTTADIELGIVDALEVATKVALEVAREVDSGESSHSSSEELSDENGQSGSQDSHDDDLHTGSSCKGLSVGENHSFEEPRAEDDDVMDEKNKIPENGMMNSDDVKERHAAAVAKSEVGREKSSCDFDLNQDISPDEMDVIMSAISTTATTAIISVSAFGMPATAALQLERTLSWEGSAATSVIHPALPHKVPNGDLREKQVICRGIDLNVAEVGDDQAEDVTHWKQFPFSLLNSRSGESSHEANPRGSSRFSLDLNCTNEQDDMPPPSELKMETSLFLSHSDQQSASPASLSFAQQSGKEVNFDLNDRPQFFIDSRDQSPYYGRHEWCTAHYGGHNWDEPALSILGTKVDVDRKDSVSQMPSFLSNGKSVDEPTTGYYMARMGNSLGLAPSVSFSPAPVYGYNRFTGPPGLSMSSSMYVPGTAVPYMVDSRGTPVMMPQVIGPTPYVQPPFPQQHLFTSLAGGSPSLNGSVLPNFDQSFEFGVEVGNRESISLRQFLSMEQSGAMGEHSEANVEPSSSSSISVGGKRKEPETRWEFPLWR